MWVCERERETNTQDSLAVPKWVGRAPDEEWTRQSSLVDGEADLRPLRIAAQVTCVALRSYEKPTRWSFLGVVARPRLGKTVTTRRRRDTRSFVRIRDLFPDRGQTLLATRTTSPVFTAKPIFPRAFERRRLSRLRLRRVRPRLAYPQRRHGCRKHSDLLRKITKRDGGKARSSSHCQSRFTRYLLHRSKGATRKERWWEYPHLAHFPEYLHDTMFRANILFSFFVQVRVQISTFFIAIFVI